MLVVLPVGFLLVLGGSFFASAKGVHLNSWLEERMSDAKPQTADDPFSDILDEELESQTVQAKQEIGKVQALSLSKTKEAINNHSQALQSAISTTTEELKAQSEHDFAAYTEQKLQKETEALNQDFTYILDEVFSD